MNGNIGDALNFTLNPVLKMRIGWSELNDGLGLHYYNTGNAIDTVEEANQAYLSYLLGVAETAFVGMSGVQFYRSFIVPSAGAVDDVACELMDDVIDPNTIRYGPQVKGPLSPDVAKTFRGGSYSQVKVGSDTTLYRVYGGNSGKIGAYWTRTKPAGPLQSQLDSALAPQWGNTASKVVEIKLPAGTTFFEGAAAPQSTGIGQLLGGGNQVYILKVDPSWVVP
jgi:hypothetical protein